VNHKTTLFDNLRKRCHENSSMKHILLSCLILFSIACSHHEKIQVAFLLPNIKNDRYTKEKVYFTEKIKELGGEAQVVDGNNDYHTQLQQVNEFLSQGIRVFVLDAVNVNLAAEMVREIHDKNAIVIAYDRLIKNADIDFYLSFQYQKIGEAMVNYITKIKPEGNYILLGGDKTDFNAYLINKGQTKALEPFIQGKKINLLYHIFIEEWNMDNAFMETNYFLNLSTIVPDAIICSSDKLAMGAIQALEKHGLAGKILVTGMDADVNACKNMLSGKQTVSIYKPFKKLAFMAAEIAMKFAGNEKLGIDTTSFWNGKVKAPAYLMEPVEVDKNNIKTTVIADGMLTEKAVFGD
jgi:D-xylose transport system substrate-binding protein